MKTTELISIQQVCTCHKIEFSFIDSLQEIGLIEITCIDKDQFVHQDSIGDIEKMIRLHRDLQLNMESIDVVLHLLQKVDMLEKENIRLQNRLRLYE